MHLKFLNDYSSRCYCILLPVALSIRVNIVMSYGGCVMCVRLFAARRSTWDRPTFHYTDRNQNHFLNWSKAVCPPVSLVFLCAPNRTGRSVCDDILIKLALTLTSSTNDVANGSDWISFSIAYLIVPYFEKWTAVWCWIFNGGPCSTIAFLVGSFHECLNSFCRTRNIINWHKFDDSCCCRLFNKVIIVRIINWKVP